MQRNDDNMNANALVESHLDLVGHVVNQVAVRYPRHVDRQDLWAAGAIGLVDASRRFDPSTGVPFPRYAAIRIRGAIIDSTRARDWATRSLRRRARELGEASSQIEQQKGRGATTAELADALDITVAEVNTRRHASNRATLLHLDQPVSDSDGNVDTLESMIAESSTDQMPEGSLEERELLGTIHVAVEHLDAVHREVVTRYFFGGELLQEIADSMGVTEARISQIRAEAITAMQSWFATRYDGVPAISEAAPGVRRRAAYVATMTSEANWQDCLAASARSLQSVS